jgi:hypothetical protein
LQGTGLQKEIEGATADDVRRLCEKEVDMRADHNAEEVRECADFAQQCYFITHKVFTYTGWCKTGLRREEWTEERDFLLTHLRHTWEAMKDVHLTGEFVQVLRCFGDTESSSQKVRDAVEFILTSQDTSTGGWQTRDLDDARGKDRRLMPRGNLPKMPCSDVPKTPPKYPKCSDLMLVKVPNMQ